MKYKVLFLLMLISALSYSQNLRGTWKGQGHCGDSTIQISLTVMIQKDSMVGVFLTEPTTFTLADSSFNGTDLHLLSSKLQLRNWNRDLQERKAKGEEVTFYQEIKYDGTTTANINQLNGEFTYLGKVYHAELHRGNAPVYRPQEPKKPYPYYSEEVKFTNKKDGVVLAGTLTLPKKDGKFPAVIIRGGSSPVNRNGEDYAYHQRFLVLADYLTRNGIAVLRYDDRSEGHSTGNFWEATAADFANDLQAGYELLASRKEIKSNEIGIIGHSEGAMVAAMAASQSDDFKFIVMLGGAGIPFRNVFDMQRESSYRNGEISKEEFEISKKRIEKFYQMVDQHMDAETISRAMIDFENKLKPGEINLNPEDSKIEELREFDAKRIIAFMISPHNLFNLNANPSDYIEKLTCPVLSLNGNKDMLVDAKINQQAIRQALLRAGNKDFTIVELDGLNHSFQECQTGTHLESLKIEQTFSPKALELITLWIEDHVEK